MKAIVFNQYGAPDQLQLEEVVTPTPAEDEILVRIHNTTVIKGDCDLRRFDVPKWIWLPLRIYMGIFRPRVRILGQEFSGIVESVGKNVRRFKSGYKVFGPTTMKFGAYAEYLCISAKKPLVQTPINWNFQESATLTVGAMNALHLLKKAEIQNGDHVLIIGAGGSIGSYAVQLGKELGAYVTGLDVGSKLESIKDFGADAVVDYTASNFTLSKNKYNAIIDLVGTYQNKVGLSALKSKGKFVQGNPSFSTMLSAIYQARKYKLDIINTAAGYHQKDLEYLKELAEKCRLTPFIDRMYPLAKMKEAHEYVESGQKTGHVVINIA